VLTNKLPLFIGAVVGLSFLCCSSHSAAWSSVDRGGHEPAGRGRLVRVDRGDLPMGLGIGGARHRQGAPIEAWAPVMFFAILFGLSMDYQVFLVSRMHEEWVHSRDNRRAITVGQAETGGIITAAAFIMITVFFGFILDPNRGVKLFGAGLASAVFLDAFVLRTVLVPSLMHMFGKANWFFPKALDKITRACPSTPRTPLKRAASTEARVRTSPTRSTPGSSLPVPDRG